jgi:hypothetical protein
LLAVCLLGERAGKGIFAMDQTPLPIFKCSPVQALKDVVATPNWVANVLWLSLAALASSVFVGYIGLFGYGAELLQRRAGRPENPAVDINSERLGDYISKGLWPFLVFVVAQVAASIAMVVPIAIFAAIMVGTAAATDSEALAAVSVVLMVPVIFLMSVALYLIITPFLIRAMVCQDFAKAFDFNWSLNFVKLMASEMILSGIIFALLSALVMLAGYALLCVGAIPASGIVMGGYVNLLAQWYEIYLSKGGPPAPPDEHEILEATIVS